MAAQEDSLVSWGCWGFKQRRRRRSGVGGERRRLRQGGVATTAPASMGGGDGDYRLERNAAGDIAVLGEGAGGSGILRGAWSRKGASPASWE